MTGRMMTSNEIEIVIYAIRETAEEMSEAASHGQWTLVKVEMSKLYGLLNGLKGGMAS